MQRRQFISSGLAATMLLGASKWCLAKDTEAKVGLVMDKVFLQHHISPDHPESPARYQAIVSAIDALEITNRLFMLALNIAPNNWLETVHSKQHIESIRENTPRAFLVASAGVAAALAGVDAISNKQVEYVFSASRPPGHHALNTGKEEGFCYFNNIAVAARYAQQKYGFKKILIVDWDYHHGNATEAMFYDDPSVLFFSTHDHYAYPGTGDPKRRGAGKGEGYNINVHLPCGANNKDIITAFERVLLPAAETFKPDFVMVSAGFDSRINDLLGCYLVDDEGFKTLTRIVKAIANQYCNGRLLSILEGGYNLKGNANAVVSHIQALLE